MAKRLDPPCIYVLAGTNGAGKSSVGGAAFRQGGADYFNPDEATRLIVGANPDITLDQANSAAWNEGRRLLQRAIVERLDFAFETTLGGTTITALLREALSSGSAVRIWYVGLASPELHLARIRARVAQGGHDIPDGKVRERFDRSRLNLISLLPIATEVRVYDNSVDGDPATGAAPAPALILHTRRGAVVSVCDLADVPKWAKPLVAAAMKRRSVS